MRIDEIISEINRRGFLQGVAGMAASTAIPAAAQSLNSPSEINLSIDSKEAFIQNFIKQEPIFAKPQYRAMLEKMIALRQDGTVDVENTIISMMRYFNNKVLPTMIETFEYLLHEIETLMTDYSLWNQLNAQDKNNVKEAYADIKKQLPVMKQKVKELESPSLMHNLLQRMKP